MTIRFIKSWNGYYEGQVVTSPSGGNSEAALISMGYAVADLDGPDNSPVTLKYDPATGKAYANGAEVAIGGGASVGTPVNFSATGSIAPGPSKVYRLVVKTGSALTLTLYDSPNTAGGAVIWSASGLAASPAEIIFPTPYQAINGVYASVTGTGTFDLYIG